MINPVSAIQIPAIEPAAATTQASAAGADFKAMLASAIGEVENSQAGANAAVQGFLTGENQELHSTILATQRANLEFDIFMQARNKVVSAYQEVMRMQV